MKTLFLTPPYQTTCAIDTNCVLLEKQLALKYGAYISVQSAPTNHMIRVTKTENGYTIKTPTEIFVSDSPLYEIDKFLFDHTKYDPRVLALHGAAVEWDGKCHLFLAATTSGKTTLTSYLCQDGFGYLTDDCILLDRQNLCVHPLATPIQLRSGGAEVLKHYNALPSNLERLKEGDNLVRYVYTPNNIPSKAVPLANIFFIERTEDENALLDMSTTERITALMKSPITNYPITGDYLRFLSTLAQKIPCYRLRYCDMNYVKELIQNG